VLRDHSADRQRMVGGVFTFHHPEFVDYRPGRVVHWIECV
jgi:hypothetical protein